MKIIKEQRNKDLEYLQETFEYAIDTGRLVAQDVMDEIWNNLNALYQQLNRNQYHNVSHIREVVDKIEIFDDILEGKINYEFFQLAALYHDCVYDPERTDNEARSILELENALKLARYKSSEIKYIRNLIVLEDSDQLYEHNIFRDIDYSILGEHWDAYSVYMEKIKIEHLKGYNYNVFLDGRRLFLSNLLDNKPIFKSGLLGLIFEKRAKTNIKKELELIN